MKFRAKIENIGYTLEGKLSIMLETSEMSADQASTLLKEDSLDVEIRKYHKRRSLDANAYAWVLMSKISNVVNSSKEEIYESMLQKYGPFYEDENGYITITVRKSVDMTQINGHWKYLKDNGKFASYLMIKGSSEYDTAEMSHFIDRIVEEAKELGIETAVPDELERMKQEWHV